MRISVKTGILSSQSKGCFLFVQIGKLAIYFHGKSRGCLRIQLFTGKNYGPWRKCIEYQSHSKKTSWMDIQPDKPWPRPQQKAKS